MVSRTPAQNATATVVRNGRTILKNVEVRQRLAAAPRLFLQIFNTNAPTVGTTAPEIVIPVPAGDANITLNRNKVEFQADKGGLDLGTGFSYAVTTTHDGSTNPTATHEPEVIIHYEQLGA